MADANVRIDTPTHPGAARDVDLKEWLDAAAFHPADTPEKQAAHEVVRQLVALLGAHLHQLLPPGRAKSLVFTGLEPVRMYANMALAIGRGPRAGVSLEAMLATLAEAERIAEKIGGTLPQDPRLARYKAEQLGREAHPEGPEHDETHDPL